VSLGINGFGRIGKLVFRASLEKKGVEVKAINDPFITNLDYLAYLLKYDSVHGKLSNTIEVKGDHLVVDGRLVKVFHEKDPSAISWGSAGVTIVAESSGAFIT
jgi:glyceraldehyde 3-phosphate dehydrogenase